MKDDCQYGCFCKLGVLILAVLTTRALLFEVCIRAADFWKHPCEGRGFLVEVILWPILDRVFILIL